MYTMKIVLFNILLICVISEIFATWSTRSQAKRIGSMKEKLSEKEAIQDILSLLNIDNEDGSKSVSLQNFPLKKLIKADFSRTPKEALEVVPLDNAQNLYSDFNGKYPKQYLTPSQFDDDSESDELVPNNKNVNSDASETDEMLFVVRLPPSYSYIKGQPLQNKPYKDNIPPIADGLSVEDMTVLEIPPDSSKESKNYYFKPDNKPQFNFYQNQHADGPKHSKFNKKLMQLIKRLMFKSKLKREMNRSKNPYRVGDNAMGRFTKVIKHNSMTYYNKLKEYLQELVAKLLNKAMKQREDQEKVRRSNNGNRFKRDTQAGYTQDPDTCKKYNENLEKMWETLSKYLNSTDPVNQQALHNIAVMVEAYMTHQNERPHLEEVDYHQEKKKDKISEVLTKIRKLLGDENVTEKVKEMVLQNFKPEYDDNTECKQTNEDNLLSSIDLSYKNYLDNAKCRGDYDTGLLRGKALLRNGAPMKPKDMSGKQFYDKYVVHKSVLDEADASEEFHKGRIPVNKGYKKRGRFNRWNNRRGFGRSAKLGRYARQSKKRHTGLRRRPKKGSKNRLKTHIRSDEACVKYANRKFLITLRTSIERFMDLRDCHQDDTLRTSNKNRKPINRRRKQASRTFNKRKFNDMTFYTDTELGQKEQRRINNYLSNIKDFNNQEINRNKSVFIVHTTSYKSPLLLKLNNKREGMHGYTSNMKQPLERPSYYNQRSKYSFDNIYKSFLESSDKDSFDTLHSKKTLLEGAQSNGGIRDINLYDIIKQKVDQEKNKRLFGTVGRQNDGDSAPLDVEPILYNNSSDDASLNNTSDTNLAQNGTSINFEEIGSMLEEVRNSTLQKPQISASSFVSNNDKGYVELSYLVKYPKSIVFRPQYLVKNILQYEEFVKVASQLYVTDEDKQLMKIVRFLPDNRTQILFETQDFKSPIEVFEVKEDIKKTKPIFSTNFSDSNEALRQRPTNETDIYNFENENETQINVLPEDRINVDSPLRENDHVNSLSEDNMSTGLTIADAFTEDIINTDISDIKPLREDNISADITRAETLTEEEIHTDLTNEDSQQESSSSTDISHLFRDDIITNDNDREDTEDLIKTEINNINLLRDSKMNLGIDKVDHLQEDNIAKDADRSETLPEEKNDTQIINTDSLRESNINAYVSETDILRNDNIIIDDDQTEHLSDDMINRELVDSLRNTKISTDTNKTLGSDSLQEEEDRTSTEQNIAHFLQESKIKYDVEDTDLQRENNISSVVNRADLVEKDKITTEDSKDYPQSDNRISTVLNEIDLLRQKKINPDAYHIENTKLNKDDSTDNNEQHLPEGSFIMDLSRIDSLQEDKIVTDDNPSDSLFETNTEEHNADSLRESNIDIEVDRAYSVSKDNINVKDVTGLLLEDNTEANDVYSLRETASTEVNRETSQLKSKNNTESAHVALRDDKIITEISKEDETSTEDNEYPLKETKIGLYSNILNNLQNSIKDSAVTHFDSMPERIINADVNRVDLLREAVGSTDGNLAESLLEDTEDSDPHTLRDSKIRTGSKKANAMQHDDISIHSVDFLPGDKTSTEENMADSLQQIKIIHDVDFADLLREQNDTTQANPQDRLKINKTNTEVDNTDYLRENKIVVSGYPRGQTETIKAEVNREYPIPEEKNDNADFLREDSLLKDSIITENNNADPLAEPIINTKTDNIDSLRDNQISPYIKHDFFLQKDSSIITEDNSADQIEIQAQVDHTESQRENQISPDIKDENSLLKDSIFTKNYNADPPPEYEIQTKVDHVDSLRENQISPYINHENSLQKDLTITGDSSADQSEIQTQVDNTDVLRENQVSPYIKHEDSLLKDSIFTENYNADALPEYEIQRKVDHIDSLRENQISPHINYENYLQKDIINTEDNSADPSENQTQIDHLNPLRENQISPYIKHDISLQKYIIIIKNNSAAQDETQSQIDNADFLRENKISPYIKLEDSLLKDSVIIENNNADPLPEHEMQTNIVHLDSLPENKINPGVKHQNSLEEENISTDNVSGDTLAEDINHLKLDNGNALQQSIISREIKQKSDFQEENFSLEVKRDYPLAENKITEVKSLQESAISTDANNATLLRGDKITTYSNRDDSLLENSQSKELNDGNEYLPLGVAGQLRNSNTNAEVDPVDHLHEENINSDISRIYSKDKISTEGNKADFLKEGEIDPTDNQADHLRIGTTSIEAYPSDSLLEDIISQKISDPLRERDIVHDVYRDNPLLEDKHSAEINSNEYNQPEEVGHFQNSKIDTDVKDPLREDNMGAEVSLGDLPKNKIGIEISQENINDDGKSVREGKTSNEFNRSDLLQVDKINAEVSHVDTLQDKISSEINRGDTLREAISSTIVNSAKLFLEETINTNLSHNIPSFESKIASEVSDSMRSDDVSNDDIRPNTLPKDVSTPEYNNKNILRVSNISTDVNREDSLTKDKIDAEVSNENSMQEDKEPINNGDPLPNDILKTILRDDEINFNVTLDKIDMYNKTDIDVSNLLQERKDKTNTESNYKNPPSINKASEEIIPVTTLRGKGDFNVPYHSEGDEVSTDDYSVNPILKDIISHEIDSSDSSHVDLLSDDNINKNIARVDTLPGEEKNLNTNRVDIIQEDTIITGDNTKGSLRESNIDSNEKLMEDLPEDGPNTGLNRDSLQKDQVSTSVTRSDPLPEDKIETDDLNLDALKEPRNYTEELDYLTYQDGFIAEGLNTSSNEFKRGGNSSGLPNLVLNETSYKYNASSALREQVIDAFNDTLNSSEFINKKDDADLNKLNKNISLPDIDAESIADYLRFTLNNAEASLSTASQAYLKELETQGLTNAATTKVLLKNWWDVWKNILTAKVQSIAGRVTNLFKKLDNTSLFNEGPAIKEEFGDM